MKTSGVRSAPRRSAKSLPTSLRIGNGQAVLLGEPADRDRPVLLICVDAEETNTSPLKRPGDLGQSRGICLRQRAFGADED